MPGSFRFIKGEIDVVEDRGNKVLRVGAGSMFGVPVGSRPNLFTLEFDAYMDPNAALCITTTKLDDYSRLDRMSTCGQAIAWMDMTALVISSGAGNANFTETGFVAPQMAAVAGRANTAATRLWRSATSPSARRWTARTSRCTSTRPALSTFPTRSSRPAPS